MSRLKLRKMLLIGGLVLTSVAGAQDDERAAERQAEVERQEIFRAGFQAIVEDLNRNSLERFAQAIDQEDMLERILGLRLIDQKVQKGFREEFSENLPSILESAFASTGGNIRAAWLGFGSKGNRGKAVVRYDLPDFQFNYHEYELRLDEKGRVVIVDWVDFLVGEKFSRWRRPDAGLDQSREAGRAQAGRYPGPDRAADIPVNRAFEGVEGQQRRSLLRDSRRRR